MQPFNHENRRKAFLFFLLFFTLTTVVVGATVFMSTQVPFRQNEQLNAEKEKNEAKKDFEEKFVKEMNGAMKLLDSLNNKDVNFDAIGLKIDEKLKSMDAMIDKDSTASVGIYGNIMANLSALYYAKKDLREAETSKGETQGDLKRQLQELNTQLLICKGQ